MARLNIVKNQANVKQQSWAELLVLFMRIVHILHAKIKRHILQNKQLSKCV